MTLGHFGYVIIDVGAGVFQLFAFVLDNQRDGSTQRR